MNRWLHTVSNKVKTTVLVATLLTAQVAGAALPFIPNNIVSAAETCVSDTAGANDQPNQKDLTKLCIDYSGAPTTVSTKWNWDETGTNGANTMDACNLFDVNNNGLADYAVCVTTKNDPAALQVYNTYSCGDTREDRCTTPITTLSNGTTTCAVSQQNTDPFPAGSSSPADTQAACTIQLSTMPIPVGGISPKLIDVCSYPSQSPNSDPSDCVIARANAGKLEVVKHLIPVGDSGLFNLQIDGVTKATNVGNNGTTTELSVSAGNHTIGELAGTATTLSNYSPSVTCRDLNGTGAIIASGTLTSLTVPVADQSDIVCVITNTRAGGQITVTKTVSNTHGGTATAGQFPLFVNATAVTSGATNSYTANQSYTVSETANAVAGYTQTSATCIDTATQASLGTTFTLGANQNVTCTITNSDTAPTLKLVKAVSNTHGGTATAANFQGKISSNNVAWGTANSETAGTTYTLSEAALAGGAGYSSSNWICDGGTQNGSQITLALGQNVTCTITNSDIAPQLTVIKHVNNNYGGGATANNFTMNVTGTNVSSSSFAGSEQGNTVTLNAGNYSVGESGGPAGYTGSSSTDCSGTLSVGQTKTCTITNSDSPASISGHKYEVNANGTQGSGGTPIQNWTVYLLVNGQVKAQTTTDAGGNYSFGNLAWGDYTLAECQNVGDCTGFTQIYGPAAVNVNGTSLSSTNNDFGNFKNGSIGGYKWNDLNGNGQLDGNEVKLPNWTVFIDANSNNTLDNNETSTATDTNGNYTLPNLAPGTYRICEQQQAGWVQTSPGNSGCYTITIDQSGETNPDTNFGNQGRGTIAVVKNVDTNGDGVVDSQNVTNWDWDINGGSNLATGSANTQNVAAGTYTVSEHQKANFHITSASCTDENNALSTSQQVTVSPGEAVVCTFTNTRDTGSLTLIKHVINDNGGTADASNFTLHVTQNGTDVVGSPAAGSEAGTTYSGLLTGTYTVSEDTPITGYTQASITCNGQATNQVTVTSNGTVSCTIVNNDVAPQLTVIKHVINDNSGTSVASDFTMNVVATNVAPNASFPGNEAGTVVTLTAGGYSVNETPAAGYTTTYSAGCTGTIAIGGTATCTVTNDDVAHPGINVVKSGPATAHEGDSVTYTFTVTNTGDTTLSGTSVSDNIAGSGVYQSGDTNLNGFLDKTETWVFTKDYTISTPQVANVDNTVTACATDPAQTQVCDTDTHTLDVLHPAISVIKSGPLYGYEGMSIGYTFTVKNTGDTTLFSVNVDDNLAIGETCLVSVLAPGDTTICTAHYIIPIPTIMNVVNTVVASGTDALGQTVTADDSHTLDVLHPSLQVVKSGPVTAHEGDTVTYTFTVTNTGDIPLSSVTVTDNVAGNALYVSGDSNANSKLDLSETWVFTKDYTISTPQTANVVNTATACGYDPIQSALLNPSATCDTDMHTLDVLHPAVHVVKSGPANAYEGDSVTYTFTVTNTGDTPVGSLTVSDDVAGAGTYQSGDTNSNDLLDLNETWIYTADYTIPANSGDIVNTVSVCSNDSLQRQACDTDTHTTHVYHPTLTVIKEVVTSQPSDDGLFNLQIDGSTAGTGHNVGDGGTTGAVLVTPGTHNAHETAGTNTQMANYDSSYTCDNDYTGTGTTTDMFSITGDQAVTCVFTNVRHATLTVVKQAFPFGTSQSFNFTLERVNSILVDEVQNEEGENSILNLLGNTSLVKEFQLDDNNDATLPNSNDSDLSPGVYQITEDATAGWNLADMSCGNVPVTKTGNTIRFELTAGQQLTCTFVNQKPPVPQVLGDSTAAPQVLGTLTNTGLPIVAYTMAAISLIGAALFTYRRQTN
jgi:uncharacterized repeat protein (TIGR01451 family)